MFGEGESGTLELRQEPPDILRVVLEGHLDEAFGQRILADVRAHLEARPQLRRALIDLTGLTGSELLGRAQLRSFQEWLKGRVDRTAYLADTPRFRGLAHIVIHGAKDQNAIAVVQREQADEWLASTQTRRSLRNLKMGLGA